MRIASLKKYRNRNPNGYFVDLPPAIRASAYRWLAHFLKRRKGLAVPGWTFAILVGQAKRLALNPPSSEWGRTMLAKRGGYAVQEKYRAEGRHPTAPATKARQIIRRARKLPRVAYLPLC